MAPLAARCFLCALTFFLSICIICLSGYLIYGRSSGREHVQPGSQRPTIAFHYHHPKLAWCLFALGSCSAILSIIWLLCSFSRLDSKRRALGKLIIVVTSIECLYWICGLVAATLVSWDSDKFALQTVKGTVLLTATACASLMVLITFTNAVLAFRDFRDLKKSHRQAPPMVSRPTQAPNLRDSALTGGHDGTYDRFFKTPRFYGSALA